MFLSQVISWHCLHWIGKHIEMVLEKDISMLGKCLGVSRRKYSPWLQTEDQVSISNMKTKLEL